MFGPEYFRVVGYMDTDDCVDVRCTKCAEKEWGRGIADVQDTLLGRANLTAIYEADREDWEGGLYCDQCGDAIFEDDEDEDEKEEE